MWALGVVGFPGFFLWASLDVPLYTTCVLRGALRFLNKILLLIKKKNTHTHTHTHTSIKLCFEITRSKMWFTSVKIH
jgi:hypothetical protein